MEYVFKSQPETNIEANKCFFDNYQAVSFSLGQINLFLDKILEHINQEREIRSEEGIGKILDEESLHYHFTFEIQLYELTIIHLFSVLEIELNNFCKEYQKHLDSPISHKDFKGNFLQRFKDYSKKVIILDYDFSQENWKYINSLQEIRNCIIHNGRKIDGLNNKNLILQFAQKSEFSWISNGFFHLDYRECKKAIHSVRNLFLDITDAAFRDYLGTHKNISREDFTS